MSRLRVAPIVEGDGEVEAARVLLERIWSNLGGEYIQVLRPVIEPKSRLWDRARGQVRKDSVERTVELAWRKLRNPPSSQDPALVLILLDADEDCPAELGPKLLSQAREVAPPDLDVACVVAQVEYETWFAASAESLARYLELPAGFEPAVSAEEARHGKAWVKRHFRGGSYRETQDQPAMTSALDVGLCRSRSRSFDKLCRELSRRLQTGGADA